MSIRYTCACGANIRLPHTAAGRKAKCKSCGSIFKVPRQPSPDPPLSPVRAKPLVNARSLDRSQSLPEPGSWLDDMAFSEARAAGEPVILDLAEPEAEEPRRTGPTPRAANETLGFEPDPAYDWTSPDRSFWTDLPAAFFFFLNPGNLIAFVALAVIKFFLEVVASFSIYGMIVTLGLNAYVCAFFMAIILETASGGEELPSVVVRSIWDDLIVPGLQFLATCLFVLLPAIALAIGGWWQTGGAPWKWVLIASGIGLFLWPAVVLSVTIGRTFSGLWPHVVFRTVIAAPHAYLAVWAALLLAGALSLLPDILAGTSALGLTPALPGLVLRAAGVFMGLYAGIVAMRAIGLFYLHYKRRLPWVAE
jgi:hypothetical protein